MPQAHAQKTFVLVPAYNCEKTIGGIVSTIRQRDLPVVVVDDGSLDQTAAAAAQAGAEILCHEQNRGKGHALKTGFCWALSRNASHIVTMDGDGQHSANDLPLLLSHQEQADLVVGQRQLKLNPMPPASFIGNCISTFFISLFCGRHFPDTQCGFRLYSREMLRRIPIEGGRFETETELLMRAVLLGMRVHWVPVQTIYPTDPQDHRTNFRNLSDSLRVISVVLRSTHFPRDRR